MDVAVTRIRAQLIDCPSLLTAFEALVSPRLMTGRDQPLVRRADQSHTVPHVISLDNMSISSPPRAVTYVDMSQQASRSTSRKQPTPCRFTSLSSSIGLTSEGPSDKIVSVRQEQPPALDNILSFMKRVPHHDHFQHKLCSLSLYR